MTWQNVSGAGRCVNTIRPLTYTRSDRMRRDMNLTGFTWQFLIDRSVVADDGCWLWQRSVTTGGYASFGFRRRGKSHVSYGHHLAYWLLCGHLPSRGMHLDHLCRVRRCVNPWHLEAVTAEENVNRGKSPTIATARDKVCQRGHIYEGKNIYVSPDGRRFCRPCIQIRSRRQQARRRATLETT